MKDHRLENGFHPLNRKDLLELLPKMKSSIANIWLAYIALPAQQLSLDPDTEYIVAVSTISVKDLMDVTSLSKPAVINARKTLVQLGELERMSAGVYKILKYKKVKNDDPKSALFTQSKDFLLSESDTDQQKSKMFTQKSKMFTSESGDTANGHQGLEENLESLRKEEEKKLNKEKKERWEIVDELLHRINFVSEYKIALKGNPDHEKIIWDLSHYDWDGAVKPAIEVVNKGHVGFTEQLADVYKQVTGRNYDG